MRKALLRPRMVWAVFLFLILQLSCAHKEPLPPSADVRKNLGTIGVASGSFKPECSLQESTSSRSKLVKGAAKGAARGAGEVLGAAPAGDYGACIALVLAPFGACIGCLVGAAKSDSTEKLDAESEAAMRNAFEQVNFQEITRSHISRIAGEKTNCTFVSLGEQRPTSPDEEYDYRSVVNEGIDTVLEISVLKAGLAGSGEIYPNLQLFIDLRTRLIRAVDGEELYAATVTYKGPIQSYPAWARDTAVSFNEELENGCEKLSERVVELLFALGWSGKVVSVEDGHTITVQRDEEQAKICLYGIDTPEKGQAFGNEAEQFTSAMVLGKVVEVKVPFRDRYGSTAALVTVEGVSLNEELVNEGLALVSSQNCLTSICDHLHFLQLKAKDAKRGLWADPNPIPPSGFGPQESK